MDVLHPDQRCCTGVGQVAGRRRARGRGGIEEAEQTLKAGRGGLPKARHIAQAAQWLEGQRHGGKEGHEIAHAPLSADDLRATQHQNGEKADPGDDIDKGRNGRAPQRHFDIGTHDAAHDRLKPVGLIGFHAVQLHGLNAMKNLVQPRCTLAGVVAHGCGLAPDIALHGQCRGDQQRRPHKRAQRPIGINRDRHHKQPDQRDHIPRNARDHHGPHALHGQSIALHPLDQRAGGIGLKELRVKGQDVAQQIHLHLRRTALRNRGQQGL